MDPEEKSRIEMLNDKLYSRTRYGDPLDRRNPVEGAQLQDIEEKWQTMELDEMLKHERSVPKARPYMKRIFVMAVVFFLSAVAIAIFVFLGGTNFVSSKNVDVSILGPTTVSAGEIFELGVTVSNTNNTDLELANFSIQYPPGARNPDNTAKSLTYARDDLGAVKAGAEIVRNVRIALLGSPGEIKEIKFSVEYKVKGSNATFYKDKVFEIVIGEAPVTLTVESPPSVVSGSDFVSNVSVTLNSVAVLKNVVLKVEYPHGYSARGAVPDAANENNIWTLGDLSPGAKKTVSIRGELVGENSEERTFRFYIGVSEGEDNPNMKIVIASLLNTVTISRPSIGLSILFNNEDLPVYIAPAAHPIVASARFKNNLSEKLFNPRLEVSISGGALDKRSVSAEENGLYDFPSSKAVWDLNNTSGQPELLPGEGGQVTLKFSSLPEPLLTENVRDITLNFLITGTEISASGQKPVSVSETRTVRITSKVNFSAKALRSLGSFANHGPIPPKTKEETTYTIVWSIGNTQGDLAESKVTARLGPNVSWLGPSDFTSEDVSYDSRSNTIIWNLGTLQSGTGFSSATRELAFQVALTPSLGQIGTTPNLVTGIVFSGRDSVSGNMVTANSPSLSTHLSADPAFIQGDEVVQK